MQPSPLRSEIFRAMTKCITQAEHAEQARLIPHWEAMLPAELEKWDPAGDSPALDRLAAVCRAVAPKDPARAFALLDNYCPKTPNHYALYLATRLFILRHAYPKGVPYKILAPLIEESFVALEQANALASRFLSDLAFSDKRHQVNDPTGVHAAHSRDIRHYLANGSPASGSLATAVSLWRELCAVLANADRPGARNSSSELPLAAAQRFLQAPFFGNLVNVCPAARNLPLIEAIRGLLSGHVFATDELRSLARRLGAMQPDPNTVLPYMEQLEVKPAEQERLALCCLIMLHTRLNRHAAADPLVEQTIAGFIDACEALNKMEWAADAFTHLTTQCAGCLVVVKSDDDIEGSKRCKKLAAVLMARMSSLMQDVPQRRADNKLALCVLLANPVCEVDGLPPIVLTMGQDQRAVRTMMLLSALASMRLRILTPDSSFNDPKSDFNKPDINIPFQQIAITALFGVAFLGVGFVVAPVVEDLLRYSESRTPELDGPFLSMESSFAAAAYGAGHPLLAMLVRQVQEILRPDRPIPQEDAALLSMCVQDLISALESPVFLNGQFKSGAVVQQHREIAQRLKSVRLD